MRILLSADAVGGVWDYVATLARELDRRGHDLIVAILGEPSSAQLAGLPGSIPVERRVFRLEWMHDAGEDLPAAADWLAGLARGWGADVAHLNQLVYPGLAGFTVPTLVVVHSDVGAWFREVDGAPLPREWAEYRSLVSAGLRAASAVIAPTRYQAELAGGMYGRRADRVIPNGFDPEPLVDRPAKRPLVVCAGRAWDRGKGVDILEDAIGRLGAAAPPARLFGPLDGPGGERFEARHLRYGGVVSRRDLQRWLAQAMIYAAPSRYEPFGLAPLEAAREGCALVLSDIGSFRELWDGCAVFVQRGDAGALAAAIGRLAADPAEAARLAAGAAARAEERYGAARFAESYLEVYGALADRPAVPAAPAADGWAS